jgi:hypothetical protein
MAHNGLGLFSGGFKIENLSPDTNITKQTKYKIKHCLPPLNKLVVGNSIFILNF